MRISDWSSDVCSSDLVRFAGAGQQTPGKACDRRVASGIGVGAAALLAQRGGEAADYSGDEEQEDHRHHIRRAVAEEGGIGFGYTERIVHGRSDGCGKRLTLYETSCEERPKAA